MNKVKQGISVIGGQQHERDMTRTIVSWCINHFNLDVHKTSINVLLGVYDDCNGSCVDNDDGGYDVEINFNQSLRDFVATITHEMIHVNQYITNKWQGDGEDEAYNMQYKLADELWKEGIL